MSKAPSHNSFRQRVVTAVLFVVIVLAAMTVHMYTFLLLFALINVLCHREFHMLSHKDMAPAGLKKIVLAYTTLGSIPFLLAAVHFSGLYIIGPEYLPALALAMPLAASLCYIAMLYTRIEKPFQSVATALAGLFYITAPFTLLLFISFDSGVFDFRPALGLLLLNWLNDTGAYLAGSRIGRHLFFPRISPKKTWEGFLGGAAVTLLGSWAVTAVLGYYPLAVWLILAGIVVVFGTLGDLVESMFKRSLSVKDTGAMLPGHGGALDRFDAFLFLLPFAAFYLLIIR